MRNVLDLNEYYVLLVSIKNLFEVLLQSMSYCQENGIDTYNNAELASIIKVKIYSLLEYMEKGLE